MSGYDPTTGIFELTQTKAGKWFRRDEWPLGFTPKSKHFMGQIGEMLGFLGYSVATVRQNYLIAMINPDQLWEALSGLPSDPAMSAYHYEPRDWHQNPTLQNDDSDALSYDSLRLGLGILPPPSASIPPDHGLEVE